MLKLILMCAFLAIQSAPLGAPKKGITKSGIGENGQQQPGTQNEDGTTQKAPTVVVQVGSPNGNAEDTEAKENLDIQRALKGFTGLLVVVGLLQVGTMIWQAFLLRGTLKAIRTQADIANRTLEAQFRPHVIVRRIDVTRENDQSPWIVEMHVENVGGTDAIVQESAFRIRWRVAFDPPHRYQLLQEGPIEGFFLEPGGERTVSISIADTGKFSGKIGTIHTALRDNKPHTFTMQLVVVVRYKYALSGIGRKTGICRALDVTRSGLFAIKDCEEEYQD